MRDIASQAWTSVVFDRGASISVSAGCSHTTQSKLQRDNLPITGGATSRLRGVLVREVGHQLARTCAVRLAVPVSCDG